MLTAKICPKLIGFLHLLPQKVTVSAVTLSVTSLLWTERRDRDPPGAVPGLTTMRMTMVLGIVATLMNMRIMVYDGNDDNDEIADAEDDDDDDDNGDEGGGEDEAMTR